MPNDKLPESRHFTLEQLTNGVYACIYKPGGAAFSNAGIIDLGDRTLLVDTFDTQLAGHDLRQAAEILLDRPVNTIALTHPHSDHWKGASAFDKATVLLASEVTRRVCLERGAEIVKEIDHLDAWEAWLKETEAKLKTEKDERVRISLENSLIRTRYEMAEMAEFQPRYADQTFTDTVNFHGVERNAEFRSLGRGHSEDDAVLLLPQDGIAFIGDVGFFNTQPFLGFCDLALYRKQMLQFLDSNYKVLVPGHGRIGHGKEDLALQLNYIEIMDELVGKVVQRGGSFEEAMQITLPEPFDQWLIGGMGRFETNVRYFYAHLGGKVPEEE